MAERKKLPDAAQAEKAVEAARAELEDAQNIQAQVAAGGRPHLVVEVAEGATIVHDGVHYSEGEQVELEGLTGMSLVLAGAGVPVGLHAGELPDEEERRATGIKEEIKRLRARIKELES